MNVSADRGGAAMINVSPQSTHGSDFDVENAGHARTLMEFIL